MCYIFFWLRVLIVCRVCVVFYQDGRNAMDWAKNKGHTACYEFLRDFDQVGKHCSEFLPTNLSFFYYLLFFNFILILFNSKLLYLILWVDVICNVLSKYLFDICFIFLFVKLYISLNESRIRLRLWRRRDWRLSRRCWGFHTLVSLTLLHICVSDLFARNLNFCVFKIFVS